LYLVLNKDKEGKCKSDDEEKEDGGKLDECVADVCKHHDVNSKPRELPNKQHKVDPCKENGHSRKLPLPVLQNKKSLYSQCQMFHWITNQADASVSLTLFKVDHQ
jgi:hypothetical protein